MLTSLLWMFHCPPTAMSSWLSDGLQDKNGGQSAGNAPFRSIPCFTSTDLQNWTFRSSALPRQAAGDLGPDRIVERPKVVYNASTSTYASRRR